MTSLMLSQDSISENLTVRAFIRRARKKVEERKQAWSNKITVDWSEAYRGIWMESPLRDLEEAELRLNEDQWFLDEVMIED